jgi:hypothetical protein
MADANSTALQSTPKVKEIAGEISCTISILRDLLKLALQEAPDSIEDSTAASVIRAAERYVDDIAKLNDGLFELAAGGKGGAK